jgi:AcrR family transcriptional regulator
MTSKKPALIRRTALQLFSEQWMDTVSVAEVCREAGVSNGLFYRYYSDKEALIRDLLDRFIERYESDLNAIEVASFESGLTRFIEVMLMAPVTYNREFSVFREGQYRYPDYEQRIGNLYTRTLERIYGRAIEKSEYLYIASGLRFISFRMLYEDFPIDRSVLYSFITRGVFSGFTTPLTMPSAKLSLIQEPPADSRDALIQAGIRLFGRLGYHKTNVFDIAREARLAVGTFYTYFSSKELFLSTIVHHIGHKTRSFLRSCLSEGSSVLDQELFGIWNFINYFDLHPEYYQIVREAEFVSTESVRDYYDRFQKGYLSRLTALPRESRLPAANFLIGISHHVGIEYIFSDRSMDISRTLQDLVTYLTTGVPR